MPHLLTRRLVRGRSLIDETVTDLAEHLRGIVDVDGYRPARCPHCDHMQLHMHNRIERKPRDEPGLPVVVVARYITALSNRAQRRSSSDGQREGAAKHDAVGHTGRSGDRPPTGSGREVCSDWQKLINLRNKVRTIANFRKFDRRGDLPKKVEMRK